MNTPDAGTRNFIKAAALGAAAVAMPVAAQGQASKAPAAGAEYRVINPAQPLETAGKIEVLEFFWYACPHCAALEPVIKAWAKSLRSDMVFRRAHVPFNELKHQQLFYTLETLGKNDQVDDKIFAAIHVDRNRMDTLEKILPVVEKAGLARKEFTDTWESFSVQTRMRKGSTLAASYKIESVPAIVVNGKYLTSPSMAGGHQHVMSVVDHLVALERGTKK